MQDDLRYTIAVCAIIATTLTGCVNRAIPPRETNLAPTVSLANSLVDDPAIDTTGNDGLWNAQTDDVGSDGLADREESGCRGTFDPVTNPDPAFDNLHPENIDRCPPDSGQTMNDPDLYTELNGRPDPGEPHVSVPRPLREVYSRIDWNGTDPDGYITAFMYRWTFKNSYRDSLYQIRPWAVVLNYTLAMRPHLVLLLDVAEMDIPRAADVVHAYFMQKDLNPETRNPGSPAYDSSYVHLVDDLWLGDTVSILGFRVHAANPSGKTFPVHETPFSGVFTFESNDILNHHTFEIRAIDNEQLIGPPDSVRFWTRQFEPPRVEILYGQGASPAENDTSFVLSGPTPSWNGIRFTVRGSDRNCQKISYSWKVDSHPWSPYTTESTFFITGRDLGSPLSGKHALRVRAQNCGGAITPDSLQPLTWFTTIEPSFNNPSTPWRALLISVNKDPVSPTTGNPSEQQIIDYYDEIFTSLGIPHDVYNPRGIGHPGITHLGQYKSVYLILDNQVAGDVRMSIPARRYMQYAYAGGNMMMNTVPSPAPPVVFTEPEPFLTDLFGFHVDGIDEGGPSPMFNGEYDCIGAIPTTRLAYPALEVDSARCDPDTGAATGQARNGAIRYVPVCVPEGFADVIYLFDSRRDSIGFEGQPVGLRRIGGTFRTVWFGIPLYYVKTHQAREAIRRGMSDLGYPF